MANLGRRAHGRFGEDRAAAWCGANGYAVLARNWRTREGELDLVARRDGVVVFCEVKARASNAFGSPAEAVTPAKQRQVRHMAVAFLADQGLRAAELRFDVVSVLSGKVEVIEGAF
jgi:putative endonuclease